MRAEEVRMRAGTIGNLSCAAGRDKYGCQVEESSSPRRRTHVGFAISRPKYFVQGKPWV